MSLRVKEAWKQRQARRARINAELAAADQAERQKWVDRDRGPDTEPWTPEMLDRLWNMLRDDESA